MEKQLKDALENGTFDNVSENRSKTMSLIRGKNNRTTELRLRMTLIRSQISGWIVNYKELPGKPDFYFPYKKLAVFVDGCFWHGCKKCGHIPKTRTEYWKIKIKRNCERDKRVNKELKKQGIKYLRFWEHELKTDLDKVINKIKLAIHWVK